MLGLARVDSPVAREALTSARRNFVRPKVWHSSISYEAEKVFWTPDRAFREVHVAARRAAEARKADAQARSKAKYSDKLK